MPPSLVESIRGCYKALNFALRRLPPGRHLSLALTALEESSLWTTEALLDHDSAELIEDAHILQTQQKENA